MVCRKLLPIQSGMSQVPVRSAVTSALHAMHSSLQGSGACRHGDVCVRRGNSLVAMVPLVTGMCAPSAALRVSSVTRSTKSPGRSGYRWTRMTNPGSGTARHRPAGQPHPARSPATPRTSWSDSPARRRAAATAGRSKRCSGRGRPRRPPWRANAGLGACTGLTTAARPCARRGPDQRPWPPASARARINRSAGQ